MPGTVKCGTNVNQANEIGTPPLHMAAQNRHLEVVRCLVKKLGADVNQTNNEGRTTLFIACARGHLSIVQCLGKARADFNRAKQGKSTPLHIQSRWKT
jgi:ankyrin repeat protein